MINPQGMGIVFLSNLGNIIIAVHNSHKECQIESLRGDLRGFQDLTTQLKQNLISLTNESKLNSLAHNTSIREAQEYISQLQTVIRSMEAITSESELNFYCDNNKNFTLITTVETSSTENLVPAFNSTSQRLVFRSSSKNQTETILNPGEGLEGKQGHIIGLLVNEGESIHICESNKLAESPIAEQPDFSSIFFLFTYYAYTFRSYIYIKIQIFFGYLFK
jgi:hypothetical protein